MLLDTEHKLPPRAPPGVMKCFSTRNICSSPRGRCSRSPFKVLARTAPNTYHLYVQATWRTCAEFNFERLLPYLCRPNHLGGAEAPGPPPPVVGADGRPEHEVQELLKFKMRRCSGRPYVLARWAGHDASGNTVTCRSRSTS